MSLAVSSHDLWRIYFRTNPYDCIILQASIRNPRRLRSTTRNTERDPNPYVRCTQYVLSFQLYHPTPRPFLPCFPHPNLPPHINSPSHISSPSHTNLISTSPNPISFPSFCSLKHHTNNPGQIPGINNLLGMIKTRRRRDALIIGCIIGLCIVLLLTYIF